jgi:nucleoside-diphosphate-sugar epimerase
VLVTGAAGLVGHGVLHHLATLDVAVTALVRDPSHGLTPGEGVARTVERVVVGDAADPEVVRDALAGVDAVIHLAALPAPMVGSAHDVFTVNTGSTFTVLEEAGAAGVGRVMVAGSINALGLYFSPVPVRPPYFPLDADAPTQAADAYSMSKWADEATARAMHRRHGTTITVLRFPMVGGLGEVPELDDRLQGMVDAHRRNPERAVLDAWAYLETRDAGRAAVLALSPRDAGVHVGFAAAPTTHTPYRTEDLIARFAPGVEVRRPLPGRTVPLDLDMVRDQLGFEAEHVLDLPELDLPELDLP